jgi:hypothetical protein
VRNAYHLEKEVTNNLWEEGSSSKGEWNMEVNLELESA